MLCGELLVYNDFRDRLAVLAGFLFFVFKFSFVLVSLENELFYTHIDFRYLFSYQLWVALIEFWLRGSFYICLKQI